ncbi:MAG: hypothetical protein Q9174_004916 [Haloplaca sp. 1 TL-2023]
MTVVRDDVELAERPFKDDSAERFGRVPINGRYPAADPQSAQVLTQINEWYQACKSQHSDCNRGQEALPKRLLQIAADATSDRVSLVNLDRLESPRGAIEYLALSYCWGQSTNSRSLRANIQQREQCGIDLVDLPPAIQDAISVTRQLGFNYLWVDALCICQDDEVEWDSEAAKMADIYGGSEFAISALASHDADTPFLLSRCFLAAEIGLIERIDVEETATVGKDPLSLCIREHPCSIKEELKFARLNSRAWAFQERILAPGVLHYGSSQAFWECNEYRGGGISETGLGQETEPERLYEHKSLRLNDGENPGTLWHNLTMDFTGRHLTVFSDRLHAISGLAARVRKMNMFSGRFVAGLWETDLVFHLMWNATENRRLSDSGDEYTEHTEENSRVPTWSWAHIERPVWYQRDLFSPFRGFESNLLAPAKFLFDTPEQDLQSTHAGAVIPSCRVLLHGFVQEMTPGAAKHDGADWFNNNEDIAQTHFDTLDSETVDHLSCHSIRMISQSPQRHGDKLYFAHEFMYLLLEKVDVGDENNPEARSVYRRIGLMKLELDCDGDHSAFDNYQDFSSGDGNAILQNGRWEEILLI